MILQTVQLTNFRSYAQSRFSLAPETTLVVGPNTAGKTNLLEAIYLLSTGRSLRANVEAEVIRQGETWTRVEGFLLPDGAASDLDRALGIDFSVLEEATERGGLALEVFITLNGENTRVQKQFKVNGVKKSFGDFQGTFRVVIFSPESLNLVLGNPGRRRAYLDRVLSSLDTNYFRAWEDYQKVVRNRNQLLWQIGGRGCTPEQLAFWDEQLFTLGAQISGERLRLFADFNDHLVDLGLQLHLNYQPSFLDRNLYAERLSQEIIRQTTLWGPHRDDFQFLDGERNLAVFGSRGEQREAVLALCLAELEVVASRTGERPILLLDDIFSELDEAHRHRVLEVLPKQQTLITSAEPELLNSGLQTASEVIRL